MTSRVQQPSNLRQAVLLADSAGREENLLSLVGRTVAELEELAAEMGLSRFRGRQLSRWIYRRYAGDFDDMNDLPLTFREELKRRFQVGHPKPLRRLISRDGSVKYLFQYGDGAAIEAVYLPFGRYKSACLSSQAGCPAGCRFCATAMGGFQRNLTAGEIVGQLLAIQSDAPARIGHIVYMGMGEPLFNPDAVIQSVRLLITEMEISGRNITISTVGVVPGIRRLAGEGLPVTLALSLHAADDEIRSQLIPLGRKWPLDEILSACRTYFERTGRRLTFEYILLEGVNDTPEQARALGKRLAGLPGNVNLIPYNPVPGLPYRRPSGSRIQAFRNELEKMGRATTQRMTRGLDVNAACGQLRLQAAEPPAADHDQCAGARQ